MMEDETAANSPLRLMRKKWSSADELAQEVYTLLSQFGLGPDAPGEDTPDGKPDFRLREGRPGADLRLRGRDAGPEFRFGSTGRARQPPDPEPSPFEDRPGRRTPEADLSRPAHRPPDDPVRQRPAAPPDDPTRSRPSPPDHDPARPRAIAPIPALFEAPRKLPEGVRPAVPPADPNVYDRTRYEYKDDSFLWRFSPYPPINYAPATSSTTLMGVVTGGTGKTYDVKLLPAGSAGASGDEVTVQCPKVSDDQTIPAGTILAPVFQFDTDGGDTIYEAYPPVWLDSGPPPP